MKEAGGWLVNGSRSETALDLPVRTAGGCGGHQLGVTAQERGFYILFHGDEVFAAFFDFRFGDDQFQLTAGDVDMDGVAVLHEPDEAAVRRFGGYVADGRTPAAATKTTVRDERHIRAEAHAHDG